MHRQYVVKCRRVQYLGQVQVSTLRSHHPGLHVVFKYQRNRMAPESTFCRPIPVPPSGEGTVLVTTLARPGRPIGDNADPLPCQRASLRLRRTGKTASRNIKLFPVRAVLLQCMDVMLHLQNYWLPACAHSQDAVSA